MSVLDKKPDSNERTVSLHRMPTAVVSRTKKNRILNCRVKRLLFFMFVIGMLLSLIGCTTANTALPTATVTLTTNIQKDEGTIPTTATMSLEPTATETTTPTTEPIQEPTVTATTTLSPEPEATSKPLELVEEGPETSSDEEAIPVEESGFVFTPEQLDLDNGMLPISQDFLNSQATKASGYVAFKARVSNITNYGETQLIFQYGSSLEQIVGIPGLVEIEFINEETREIHKVNVVPSIILYGPNNGEDNNLITYGSRVLPFWFSRSDAESWQLDFAIAQMQQHYDYLSAKSSKGDAPSQFGIGDIVMILVPTRDDNTTAFDGNIGHPEWANSDAATLPVLRELQTDYVPFLTTADETQIDLTIAGIDGPVVFPIRMDFYADVNPDSLWGNSSDPGT